MHGIDPFLKLKHKMNRIQIAQAQEAKLVTGLVPHLIENGVVILQYADDIILLVQDDME
jgi:hypothetical protein